MTSLRVVKVKTIFDLFDRNRILVRSVFENELLEIQESTFMIDFLPHLDNGLPSVLCSKFCAVRALSVQDDVLNLEYLL